MNTTTRLPLPPPRPGRPDPTPTPKPLRADDSSVGSPTTAARTTPVGGLAAQATPAARTTPVGGISAQPAARTTPVGGLAAQPAPAARTTPVGGLTAQPAPAARTTPVGGLAAQTAPVGGTSAPIDRGLDLDDDLAIPVEGSRPPSASLGGILTLPPDTDDSLAPPVATADRVAPPPPLAPEAAPPAAAPFAPPDSAAASPAGPSFVSPAPFAPTAALPFAPPAPPSTARYDDATTPARPMPRASTDTTPLPPPPMSVVPPAEGAPVQHPRVPSEWLADRGDSRAATGGRKDPSALEDALLAAPARGGAAASKKLVMIGGGVAVVALGLILALTRGGSSKQPTHGVAPATGSAVAMAEGGSSAAVAGAHDDSTTTQPAHDRHGGQRVATVASGGSAAMGSDETVGETGSADAGNDAGSGSAVPAPAPKHRPTLGGKQVVLEYDTPSRAQPAAPREDSAAVARARAAYANGNQRLFAGDAAGAVRAYQQALDAYPGYVAGYRGLGLAYAQQGDKAKALQAFHTYLANAPGAKDTALIRKRESMLR